MWTPSMDPKVMLNSNKGQKFVLIIIGKVTRYFICVPLHYSRSERIGEILTENIIIKFVYLDKIIMDQSSSFIY